MMLPEKILPIFKIILGNILMGFAYAKWMKPDKIINGGVTSVSMILEKVSGIPIIYLTNGVTIILLVLCFVFLGKENFFRSLLSSICYNLFFSMFYLAHFQVSINLPIDFLFASFFIATGYYCCISANASTVGMDVIALILHKKDEKINIAKTIRTINFIVLGVGLLTYGWFSVLIGILFSVANARILSFFLEANRKGQLI